MAGRASICGMPNPLAGSLCLAAARIRVLRTRGARNQLRARMERSKQHWQGLSDPEWGTLFRRIFDCHEHLLRQDHQNGKRTYWLLYTTQT